MDAWMHGIGWVGLNLIYWFGCRAGWLDGWSGLAIMGMDGWIDMDRPWQILESAMEWMDGWIGIGPGCGWRRKGGKRMMRIQK
jgi:hypothetical protein